MSEATATDCSASQAKGSGSSIDGVNLPIIYLHSTEHSTDILLVLPRVCLIRLVVVVSACCQPCPLPLPVSGANVASSFSSRYTIRWPWHTSATGKRKNTFVCGAEVHRIAAVAAHQQQTVCPSKSFGPSRRPNWMPSVLRLPGLRLEVGGCVQSVRTATLRCTAGHVTPQRHGSRSASVGLGTLTGLQVGTVWLRRPNKKNECKTFLPRVSHLNVAAHHHALRPVLQSSFSVLCRDRESIALAQPVVP